MAKKAIKKTKKPVAKKTTKKSAKKSIRSKSLKMGLADYVDVLNAQALELAKYEGFYPDRYLISKNEGNDFVMKTAPTNDVEMSVPDYEIKINKLNPMDEQWFIHAAFAQTVLYKSVVDVLQKLNKDNSIFEQKGSKFVIKSKKKYKRDEVQDQLDIIELSVFRALRPFENFSIADFVKPKKEETVETVKQKIESLVRSVDDSITRLAYFEQSPKFNQVSVIDKDKETITLTLDKKTIFNAKINWKTIKLDAAYNTLVEYCTIAKAVLNTLEFYREICGSREPRVFATKLFKKDWKITQIGNQYMDCLQVETLIKELYNIK